MLVLKAGSTLDAHSNKPQAPKPLSKLVGAISQGFWDKSAENRLAEVVSLLKETSSFHDDPQQAVLAYARRIREWSAADRVVSISRRGLIAPEVRITRSSTWKVSVNPWEENDTLPKFDRGFFSNVIHSGEARIIADLALAPDESSSSSQTRSKTAS